VPPEDECHLRLFVDADGRLSELLARLNIETSRVLLPSDRKLDRTGYIRRFGLESELADQLMNDSGKGFVFVEMVGDEGAVIGPAIQAIRELLQSERHQQSRQRLSSGPAEPQALPAAPPGRKRKGRKAGLAKLPAVSERPDELSATLFARLVDTFGSELAAHNWLSSECGDLNNRTPLEVIHADGTGAEVEHILDCIDHGMIA
jgi:hypothetical protein